MNNIDFYNIAASIIPLLFIAHIVEQKIYDPVATRGADAKFVIRNYLWTIFVFFIGEIVALWVLYTAVASSLTGWIVAASLLSGSLRIVVAPLHQMLAKLDSEVQQRQRTASGYLLFTLGIEPFVVITAVLVLAFLMHIDIRL